MSSLVIVLAGGRPSSGEFYVTLGVLQNRRRRYFLVSQAIVVALVGLVLRQRQGSSVAICERNGSVRKLLSSSYLQEDSVLLLSLRLRDEHLMRWSAERCHRLDYHVIDSGYRTN